MLKRDSEGASAKCYRTHSISANQPISLSHAMSWRAIGLLSRLQQSQLKGVNSLAERIIAYRKTLYIVAFAGTTTSLIRAYLYEIADGEGMSMFPTIPDTSVLMGVNRTCRLGRGIKQGDCVQFASPLFPRKLYNKRVIGLPGDYVLRSRNCSPTPGDAPLCGITDWRKRLRSEAALDEFGAHDISEAMEDAEWDEPEMIQVPEGHVWVEGDNLSWSRDSRFFGPVPMALIKGRTSWWSDGLFSWNSLEPGRGLREVEEWEEADVLGNR